MMPVYFIECGPGGPIKIGCASNPWQRRADLQTASPYELRILAVIPGDRETERALHIRFNAARGRGEWFDRTTEILAFIDGVVAGQTVPPKEMPVHYGLHGFTIEQIALVAGIIDGKILTAETQPVLDELGGDAGFDDGDAYLGSGVLDEWLAARLSLGILRAEEFYRRIDTSNDPYRKGASLGAAALAVARLRSALDVHHQGIADARLAEDGTFGVHPDPFCEPGESSPLDDDPVGDGPVH